MNPDKAKLHDLGTFIWKHLKEHKIPKWGLISFFDNDDHDYKLNTIKRISTKNATEFLNSFQSIDYKNEKYKWGREDLPEQAMQGRDQWLGIFRKFTLATY